MRVAHLCENWGKGGIQYLVTDLCNAVHRRGVSSSIAFFYDDNRVGPDCGASWAVRPIRMKQHMRVDPAGLVRLRQELALFSPDILHCHGYYTALAALILRKCGVFVPIVYSVHADLLRGLQRSNFVIRRVARSCECVVAVSKHTASTVEDFTDGRVRPVVVCNGIDVERITSSRLSREQSRRSLNLEPETLVLLTVARLTTQKDHPTLFRALASATKLMPHIRLLVVSDGPERRRLEALAGELGLQREIVFYGEVPNVNVFLSAADVFVLSSKNEGFGICVVEAACMGLPIVATALGPLIELKQSGLGISLAKPGNVDSLREAILMMSDSGVRESVGQGNSDTARSLFSIERTADEYLSIYTRLAMPATGARMVAAVSG
jgi:glycosyltransferase involved in cell wall biosynthesis